MYSWKQNRHCVADVRSMFASERNCSSPGCVMFSLKYLLFATALSFLFTTASSQVTEDQSKDVKLEGEEKKDGPIENPPTEISQDSPTPQKPTPQDESSQPQEKPADASDNQGKPTASPESPQPQEKDADPPGSQPQEKPAETPASQPQEAAAPSQNTPTTPPAKKPGVGKSKPPKKVFNSDEYLKSEEEVEDTKKGKPSFMDVLNVMGDVIEITTSTVGDVIDDIVNSQGRKVTATVSMVARDIMEGIKDVAAEMTHKN